MLDLRNGVSGILRVKNDALFIERCVDSCIAALDELVIVFNGCTDRSEDVIEKMRQKYPNKIKVYEYKPKVYGTSLTREEYEMAKCLPDDSPHLLCNYYNFALSKVTCTYAMKVDADQIYHTTFLKTWCDFCRKVRPMRFSIKAFSGLLFSCYLSAYRFFSLKVNHVLPLMPQWFVDLFYPSYLEYAKYLFSHDRACFSMSGLNIFEDNHKLSVSLGGMSDIINILPPFNGEGDHVLFKVSEQTYYGKMDMQYYNLLKSSNYSLIEIFIHPYRIMFVGFFWAHISAMRPNIKDRVLKVKNAKTYMPVEQFLALRYKRILKITDKSMFNMFQRILFSFIYKANRKQLKQMFIQNG